MACRGVLFAVPQERAERLKALKREERVDTMYEEIEEVWFDEHRELTYELDKSWDAMHRALTGGALEWGDRCAPRCWVILGGEVLYGDREGEDDYIMTLKTAAQVKQVAGWLEKMDEAQFRRWYFAIDPEEYGMELSEEDFEYTWAYFSESAGFWKTAAERGLEVLFTVDQ